MFLVAHTHLHFFDAILSKNGCRATNRAKVEAPVLLTGLSHSFATVSLGKPIENFVVVNK